MPKIKILSSVKGIFLRGSIKNSKNNKLKPVSRVERVKTAVKIGLITFGSLTGLISEKAKANDYSLNNKNVFIERTFSNRSDLKIEGKPVTNNPSTTKTFIFPDLGRNQHPVKPSSSSSKASAERPVSGFVPYRFTPKSYDKGFQGLQGHRPKRGGNDNPPYKNFSVEFEEKENDFNKNQTESVEYPTFSSYLRSKLNERTETKNLKKKIKKLKIEDKYETKIKLEDEEISQYLKERPRKILYSIHADDYLLDAAAQTVENIELRSSIESLIQQAKHGNTSPGSGSHKVDGLKYTWSYRNYNGARIYYRYKDQMIEILAVSNKKNQNQVIAALERMNY
jgi:hypothetical protein